MLDLIYIQNMFYNVYKKLISIEDFETWIYENDNIENFIGKELYFELISINYRKKHALEEVEKLVLNHIDFARMENLRITGLLKSIIDDKGDIYEIMAQLYDDYCQGYSFLRYLALSFITSGVEEQIGAEAIRKNLLNWIYKYKREANRVLNFFNKGEIKITEGFNYEDFRIKEDRIELSKINEMLNS